MSKEVNKALLISRRIQARPHLVDATRLSDQKTVYIKRVQTGDQESAIARMLTTPELLKDPFNHCVPIIDTFEDDQDPSISYIVMPFLKTMDEPSFERVEEVVEFVDQILEVHSYASIASRVLLRYRALFLFTDTVSRIGTHYL